MIIKYTAFLDVLGFSNYMKTSITNEEEAEEFHISLKQTVDKYLDGMEKEDIFKNSSHNVTYLHDIQLEYSWISDTFVVSLKYDLNIKQEDIYLKPTMIHYLSSIVSQINHFFVMEYQLCLRGAITSKFTYLKDRILLGKGIAEAHELESKIASNPRVIFASDIITDEINNILNEDLNSCILKDCDGWYFIDFFNLLKESPPVIYIDEDWRLKNTDKSEDELLVCIMDETMKRYENMINKNLLKHKDNQVVLAKYLWLKEYYEKKNENEK